MRLIDADDFRDFLSQVKARYNLFSDEERPFYEMHSKALDILNIYLDDAPTIEPKQGEWIYCEDENGQDGYKCSECGFFVPWYYSYEDIEYIKKYHSCPSCGSKNKINTD